MTPTTTWPTISCPRTRSRFSCTTCWPRASRRASASACSTGVSRRTTNAKAAIIANSTAWKICAARSKTSSAFVCRMAPDSTPRSPVCPESCTRGPPAGTTKLNHKTTMFKKKTRGVSDFQTHHRSTVLVNRLPAWRSRLVVICVTAAFLTLAGRALWVQVIDHKFYLGEGQKRYQRTLALSATRGRIVDRNGAMLAVSLATYEVWATPRLFDGDHGNEIARLLDMPPKDLQRRIEGNRAF